MEILSHHPSNSFTFLINGDTANKYRILVPPRPGQEYSKGISGTEDPLEATATVTSSTADTVTCGGSSFTVGAYVGKILVVTSGANAGKSAVITANSATVLTLGTYGEELTTGLGTPTVEIREPSAWIPVITSIKIHAAGGGTGYALYYTDDSGTLQLITNFGNVSGTASNRTFLNGLQIPGAEGRDIVAESSTATMASTDQLWVAGYYVGAHGATLPNSP